MAAPKQPGIKPVSIVDADGNPGGITSNNTETWSSGRLNVTTAGTAEQLPDQAVPNGFAVVVKALDGNTGNIFIGKDKATAEGASSFPIGAAQALTLKVDNVNDIWVDAAVDGEGVAWAVESAS